MPKITNNSVLFQLGTLAKQPTDSPLTDIRPLSGDQLRQAHDAWARQFATSDRAASIVSQPQPGFFRRVLDNRAMRKRVDGLVKRYVDGEEAALNELVAMGGDAVDRLCDLATEHEQYENILKCAQRALGEIGDVRVLERLKEVDGGETPEGYRRHVPGTWRLAAALMRSCTVDQLIESYESEVFPASAIKELCKRGDPRAVGPFIDYISHYARMQQKVIKELCKVNAVAALGHVKSMRRKGFGFRERDVIEALERSTGVYLAHELVCMSGLYEESRSMVVWILRKLGMDHVIPWLEYLARPEYPRKNDILARVIEELGKIGDPRGVDPLLSLLGGPYNNDATEVLSYFGDPRAVEPLIEMLAHKFSKIRNSAAIVLGKIADSRGIQPLLALLREGNDGIGLHSALLYNADMVDAQQLAGMLFDDNMSQGVQLTALSILGNQREPRIDILTRALGHSAERVRMEAVKKLGKIPGAFTMEEFCSLLGDLNDQIREYAAEKLRTGGAEAAKPLVAALMSDDENMRKRAGNLLVSHIKSDAREALLAAWRKGDAAMRMCLVDFLEAILEDEGLALLVGAMDGGDHALRLRIVQCLKIHAGAWGKQPYLGATDALINCLTDPNPDIRENAAYALGDMHRKSFLPQAIDPLSGLLDDPEYDVRWAAACALKATGDPHVTDTLITFLSDGERVIRHIVIRMLGHIGDEKTVEAIVTYVAAHEEEIEGVFGELGGDVADSVMIGALDNLGSLSAGAFGSFIRIARQKKLPRACEIFDRLEAERAREEKLRAEEAELRAEIEEQFERVIAEIRDKIAQGMGFDASAKAAAGGTESYASVSAGQSMRLELRPEIRMEMQPDHSLRIDPSEGIEEARERMRTLNFLAHHEMGHLIQKEKKIPSPTINVARFSLLDAKQVEHDANEMVIDKLAIEAARQIYVHGGGDLLLEEDQRVAIAIRAYLTLAGVVIRNHQNGTHPLKPETMARIVAVLMELAKSKDVLVRTKKANLALAERIYNEIVGERGHEHSEQIDRLVKVYRKIFMKTKLPR